MRSVTINGLQTPCATAFQLHFALLPGVLSARYYTTTALARFNFSVDALITACLPDCVEKERVSRHRLRPVLWAKTEQVDASTP